MSNETYPNKNTALVLDQQNITGIDKYLASLVTLSLAGNNITPALLKAVFQGDIDATLAVDATEAELKQLRAKQKQARKAAITSRKDLKSYILGNYGATAVQMLKDFGFSEPKPRGVKTVASKAQAIAQAKATRTARHTMGSKQRARIKGAPVQPPPPALPPGPTAK